MRPSAQRKWVWFAWEKKIISIPKAVHFTSFWYRGWGELGNGLFARVDMTSHFRNSRENGYKHWMQRFLVWWLVDGIQGNHKPIIRNACPPKRSQKSLRRKLAPIPLNSFWGGEQNLSQSKQMQRTNRQQKKSSRCQKETRSRATCYQYLRIYLSHPSTLTAWGDFFSFTKWMAPFTIKTGRRNPNCLKKWETR